MTVNQIVEITGKNETTIIRRIKKIFPMKDIQHGVLIDLPEYEAYRVLKSYQSDFQVLQSAGVSPAKCISSEYSVELLQATAKLVHELRLAKMPEAINSLLSKYLGLGVINKLAPSLPTKEEQTDKIVGHRVRAKQARKTEDHKTQIRLFEDGA